jgi:hypothetical protein
MKRLATLAAVTLLFLSAAPVHAAAPAASLRLTEGCSPSLVVDYSDFGPTDFLVGYVEVNSQPVAFYVADLSGTGTVPVAGPLEGTVTADEAVDPFPADAATLASFADAPPGYDPDWFSTPHVLAPSCAVSPLMVALTPPPTATVMTQNDTTEAPFAPLLALLASVACMALITRRAARS